MQQAIQISSFIKKTKCRFKKTLFRVLPRPLYQKLLVWHLRNKEQINVVFVATSLPMWRYQNLYELMSAHPRFKADVVILPCLLYSQKQRTADVEDLKEYFGSMGIAYHVGGEGTELDIRRDLHPDVLFYPQPYVGLFRKKDNYTSFKDRLLCYCPYAFWTATGDWSYRRPLHRYAWKLFYSTVLHRKEARRYNRRRNVEVVGYPNADNFLYKEHVDVWKHRDSLKKRVIWAPHFSISSGLLMCQSNFLWMAEFMLKMAQDYADKIQFVFKPHPRLLTELYKHPDWGEEKTNRYYQEWASMENTQIETGDFVDLFMTSDAMIHDCGSFSVEYHYSGNPVMFVARDFDALLSEKGDFGKLALKQHYVGATLQDISAFIDDVVLKGNDTMKSDRERFKEEYLLPPNGKTVAQNMMDVFIKSFC